MRLKFNKGLTLVELLVAIAILGIVLLWVAHFLLTSTNLFTSENHKASVQNEVQFAATQISDLVKSSQLGVSYATGEPGALTYKLSDSGEASEKILYIFNLNTETSLVDVTMVKWSASDKKIQLAVVSGIENKTTTDADNTVVSETVTNLISEKYVKWELLSENINGFFVDMTGFGQSNSISVKVTSERKGKTYESSQTTKVRNNIILNAVNISELYELSDNVIATIIKSITVSAQNSTTVPGGQLLISTKVSGEGYPSQSIYKWKVVKLMGNNETDVLYDSKSEIVTETKVDTTTGILSVAEDVESTILRVYAYANTRSNDEEFVKKTVDNVSNIEMELYPGGEIKTILIYDYVDIAIRDISSFTIKPNPNLSLNANNTLKSLTNNFAAVTRTSSSEVVNPGSMDVYPGNVIQMDSTVTGQNLTETDKSVYWTLDALNSDVTATISNQGVLMIDKYSGGGKCLITCHSILDTRLVLQYYVNIGNAFIEGNNILNLECPSSVNRGSETQLKLYMNGNEVPKIEFSNFVWTLELKDNTGREITNKSATIDANGVLSVSSTLSYAYSFNLSIKVSLRSNSLIYVTKPVSIPKLSISLNNKSYISKNVSTIPYGEIKANVVGLEKGYYTLTWQVASEMNPNYYLASYANGTHVTADRDNSCELVLNEAQNVTYVRLRANISGYSSYSAICKVILRDVDFSLDSDKNSVSRSNSTDVIKLSVSSSNFAGFSANDVEWEISEVKCGDKTITNTSGLVLERTQTGARLSALPSFYLSTQPVTLKVSAKWAGKVQTKSITINPINLSISGPADIPREGSASFKVSCSGSVNISNIEWSYTFSKTNTSGILLKTSTADPFACEIILSKDFVYPTGGATITLTAKVPNTEASVSKKITLQPFGNGFDLEDDPFEDAYGG